MSENSPHSLSHMALVGAQYDSDGRLLPSYRLYASLAFLHIKALGAPVSADIARVSAEDFSLKDQAAVKVVNLDPRWGGEDFLKTDLQTDILTMCNIGWKVPGLDIKGVRDDVGDKITRAINLLIRNDFRLSQHNDDIAVWQNRVEKSGAKIVPVVGLDDIPPAYIAGNEFVMIEGVPGMKGLLARRSYVQDLGPYLPLTAPLHRLAKLIEQEPQRIVFFHDRLHPPQNGFPMSRP